MTQRFWKAITTWLMLSDAFEASCLSRKVPLNVKWELLREKFRREDSQRLRLLPCGFAVRKNRSDMNVLISMPFEYNLLEWNFHEQPLVVVDAGANIGTFAFYLNCFAEIERYVGIEAAPMNFAVLQKNIERLGPNFSAVQCALSDERRDIKFSLIGNPPRFRTSDTGESVRGLPLDAISDVKDLPSIDILKIDVEEGEVEALKGAQRTLARTRYVVMEIHHAEIGPEGTACVFEIMGQNFYHMTYQRSPDMRQSNSFFWRRDVSTPLCSPLFLTNAT